MSLTLDAVVSNVIAVIVAGIFVSIPLMCIGRRNLVIVVVVTRRAFRRLFAKPIKTCVYDTDDEEAPEEEKKDA